jgi:hypothetical protein
MGVKISEVVRNALGFSYETLQEQRLPLQVFEINSKIWNNRARRRQIAANRKSGLAAEAL